MSNGIALASGIVEIATGPTGPTGPTGAAATGATGDVQFSDGEGGNAADDGFKFTPDDGENGDTLTIGDAVISSLNDVVTVTTTAQGSADTDGISVSIAAGEPNGDANGGDLTIAGGQTAAGYGYGGDVLLFGGESSKYEGGTIEIASGSGAVYSGDVTISTGKSDLEPGVISIIGGDSANGHGGDIQIRGGLGYAGDGGNILIQPGSGGTLLMENVSIANGTVASVLTPSSGPTGAQTAVQGWLKVNISGTDRFLPFW